tara:strand:+ start:5548 stop:5694 length:147 start_codon:yes stop_codon:yes gene_type:complete
MVGSYYNIGVIAYIELRKSDTNTKTSKLSTYFFILKPYLKEWRARPSI